MSKGNTTTGTAALGGSVLLSQSSALSTADATAFAGGMALVIDKNVTLSGNTTITATAVRFAGGKITRGAYTLTFNGVVLANEDAVLFDAAGTGGVTFKMNTRLALRWFGVTKTGLTDDTNAVQQGVNAARLSRAALQSSSGNGGCEGAPPGATVVWPAGDILITSTILSSDPYTYHVGAGRLSTHIIFRPTVASSCLKLQYVGGQMVQCGVKSLSFWSDNPHNVVMVALDLYDLDTGAVEDVFVGGSYNGGLAFYWHDSTNSSIGIRFSGRDQAAFSDLEIQADKPFDIAANPNAPAAENEDANLVTLRNFYLFPTGTNKGVTVEPGHGVQNIFLGPYGAAIGGGGLISLNDTRPTSGGTLASLNIVISGPIDIEQQSDGNAYVIDLQAPYMPIGSVVIENIEMAVGTAPSHGIRIVNPIKVVLSNITAAMAAGKDSINISGGNGTSSIAMAGCRWQCGSNFTLTGYVAQSGTGAFNSVAGSGFAGPSEGVYTFVPGTNMKDFRYNGGAGEVRVCDWSFTLPNTATQNISAALKTQGVTVARFDLSAAGATTLEGGSVIVTPAQTKLVAGTANFQTTSAAKKLSCYVDGSGNVIADNQLGESVNLSITGRARF